MPTDADKVDVNCICFVSQPIPLTISKSEGKKVKFEKTAKSTNRIVLRFTRSQEQTAPPSLIETDRSFYSHVLEALLPSRAPPRL